MNTKFHYFSKSASIKNDASLNGDCCNTIPLSNGKYLLLLADGVSDSDNPQLASRAWVREAGEAKLQNLRALRTFVESFEQRRMRQKVDSGATAIAAIVDELSSTIDWLCIGDSVLMHFSLAQAVEFLAGNRNDADKICHRVVLPHSSEGLTYLKQQNISTGYPDIDNGLFLSVGGEAMFMEVWKVLKQCKFGFRPEGQAILHADSTIIGCSDGVINCLIDYHNGNIKEQWNIAYTKMMAMAVAYSQKTYPKTLAEYLLLMAAGYAVVVQTAPRKFDIQAYDVALTPDALGSMRVAAGGDKMMSYMFTGQKFYGRCVLNLHRDDLSAVGRVLKS